MDKARMEFIRSLEGVELAPLPRRFDTQPIQFDALRVCICDECGAEAQREGRRWHRGFLCPACLAERDLRMRRTADRRKSLRPGMLAALTTRWSTIADVFARVVGAWDRAAIQGALRRMYDDGQIEGRDAHVGGRWRRCYRPKRVGRGGKA